MSMTFDHQVTLIKETIEYDKVKNPIPVETPTTILCDAKSITRSEFYNASINDMKPEIAFTIHNFEYVKQKLVEFEGERYTVIRTYRIDNEYMELTCQKVIGNG
ncbi:phage head closure protein [Gracilibacillus sp. HCP3S3_G5_1]|uniref:phage head closure protein n=1 Tax=unclassified Gracilibacillus TaxID=2625209 RepID=UPI003F8ACC7C